MKTDENLQKDVMEELSWDPIVDTTEIRVAVKNGIVTLTGNVSTYAKKIAAEKAVKSVSRVKGMERKNSNRRCSLGYAGCF